ncbi:MAG: amino acid permease [Fidelibacterota bacterium]|nr:MAG: amino acid permease [Candidatus Neomarinimicrobiota bacterium]
MGEARSGIISRSDSLLEPRQPTLRKTLGVFDGVAILIGITIGAGIYSTPQIIAGYQESFYPIIALWIFVGFFVFLGGLIYAELGSRLPNTGGEYVYISRCFGPFAGFMFGWAQLFIIRTSPAAGLAIVTANYMGYFVELNRFAHTAVALSVIGLLGALNYVGIRRASVYQQLSTVLKVGGLTALVILGLTLVQGQENLLSDRVPPIGTLSPFGNTVAALMLIAFTYIGWDRVGYAAGEMKNPRRVIPLSMFIGIATLILVYALINVIYHRTLGMEGMRASTIVASDVAASLIGPLGAGSIALLVMISATGSINGTMMTATRAYYAMARDGLFFKWLSFVHPKFRTPSRAILAHCFWAAVILLIRGTFETIVAGMVFAILIFYTFTTLALFKMRKDAVGGQDVYRVPLFPVLPGLYLAGILALLIFRAIFEWEKSLVDLAFIATGLPFSLIWCRRERKLAT